MTSILDDEYPRRVRLVTRWVRENSRLWSRRLPEWTTKIEPGHCVMWSGYKKRDISHTEIRPVLDVLSMEIYGGNRKIAITCPKLSPPEIGRKYTIITMWDLVERDYMLQEAGPW